MNGTAELDNRVRLEIYERFLGNGRPPTAAETAAALGLAEGEAEASYRRLEQARVIVLAPGTTNVWMAHPLSAVPTPFLVESERGDWWGNCVWDGLGVVAMLGRNGRVTTWCPDCGEQLVFEIGEGELAPVEAVVHFAVPAVHWWDNIAFN